MSDFDSKSEVCQLFMLVEFRKKIVREKSIFEKSDAW